MLTACRLFSLAFVADVVSARFALELHHKVGAYTTFNPDRERDEERPDYTRVEGKELFINVRDMSSRFPKEGVVKKLGPVNDQATVQDVRKLLAEDADVQDHLRTRDPKSKPTMGTVPMFLDCKNKKYDDQPFLRLAVEEDAFDPFETTDIIMISFSTFI